VLQATFWLLDSRSAPPAIDVLLRSPTLVGATENELSMSQGPSGKKIKKFGPWALPDSLSTTETIAATRGRNE
jgi:hypothetical protein